MIDQDEIDIIVGRVFEKNDLDEIVAEVAEATGIPAGIIVRGGTRVGNRARRYCYYKMNGAGATNHEIAAYFGRTESAVVKGVKSVKQRLLSG